MKKLILSIITILFCVPAMAATYTWEDNQGTVNFSEDLGKVPKKYRKKVRVLGEVEPPVQVKEEPEKPTLQQQPGDVPQGQKQAVTPQTKVVKNAIYGGKPAAEWQSEFSLVRGELKGAEDQLVQTRNRMKDVSGMSRAEYLSLQKSLKNEESNVLGLRKKLDDLKQEAGKAEVPAELME